MDARALAHLSTVYIYVQSMQPSWALMASLGISSQHSQAWSSTKGVPKCGHCPDLCPLTFLTKVTMDLGHTPQPYHTFLMKVKILKKVTSLQWHLCMQQSTCARAIHMHSSLLPCSSHLECLPLTTFNFVKLHKNYTENCT